ncbi:MAG: GntR family transcriptional regulator [Eubacteriales bacterium]|nr:GntR family transcriptional regulator [Eubacteriales bacterium]
MIITGPKYQQIAADIAAKIVDGHYKVGEKVYARSSLASQYGVSSETARRAVCVLSHLKIVESTKGSGVIIKSYENALKYVKQYKNIQELNKIKQDIIDSVNRQKKEIRLIDSRLTALIDKTDRFSSINPFIPFQIEITADSICLNKSIGETSFWHNTSATIIAVERNKSLTISPGPYTVFKESDIFYFVGDEDCYERVHKFLYSNENR